MKLRKKLALYENLHKFALHKYTRMPFPAHRTKAEIAQLVEHQLPKLRAAGSNPVFRSTESADVRRTSADLSYSRCRACSSTWNMTSPGRSYPADSVESAPLAKGTGSRRFASKSLSVELARTPGNMTSPGPTRVYSKDDNA